jgi:hypothetical protein
MKRLLFIAALAAFAPACVEGINPVQLVRARQADKSCGKPADGVGDRLAGFLDYSLSNQYIIALGLFSPLDPDAQSTTGTGFVGDEIIYNYESQGVKATFKEETRSVYFAVSAGADPQDSFVILNLIGTEAVTKLDSLVPTAPDSMTLLATVKIKGKLASGKSTETNELTYPITLTREGCPEGKTPTPNPDADICNPAQDGGYLCL